MRVGGGNQKTKKLECINPKKDTWVVRWDFIENEKGASFEEASFSYKPSLTEIKNLIYAWYNKQTDKAILEGFVWKNMSVWLSAENQFNYKAAYDLAVQTNGITLPVKFKFGNPENPIYYVFKDLPDFTDFYASAMKYINDTLAAGWLAKDNINWDNYK